MVRTVFGCQTGGLIGECSVWGTVVVKRKAKFSFPVQFEVNITI